MKRRLRARQTLRKWQFVCACLLLTCAQSCVKLPRRYLISTGQSETGAARSGNAGASRVDINSASSKELERLPGIGRGLAERIIAHREKYGTFRLPEHLMMVHGISEHRFFAMRGLITAE
jgi:competence ComEA-like helix-hairpin-helix protein